MAARCRSGLRASRPRPGLRGLLGAILLAVGLALAPAAAQEPQPAATAPAAAPRIDTAASATMDRAIERRLRSLFGELDGLGDLHVAVKGGVVELSGEVLSSDLRDRAERLARQVEGVVEVQNRIEEVRDVQRRIAPVIDRLVERAWSLVAWLPLAALAAGIVVFFWLLGWIVGRWDAPFRRVARNHFLAELLQQVVRGAILLVGVVIALDLLDATALVGTVLGAAGILGLALGFALRDTVENYIASLLLSLRQPFNQDDLVAIEGWEGRVLRLTSRATVLMTARRQSRAHPERGHLQERDRQLLAQPEPPLPLRRRRRHRTGSLRGATARCRDAGADGGSARRSAAGHHHRDAWRFECRDPAGGLGRPAAGRVPEGAQRGDPAGEAGLRRRDVTMPEPIYSVRMSGAAPGASGAAPAARVEPSTPQGPHVAIDIAPQDDLERQIRSERREHAEDDLLRADAPKE